MSARLPGPARIMSVLGTATLLISLPSVAAAATPLPRVQVTANRIAQPLEELLAPALVLTRDDIERSTALDVPGLLRGLPGLHVATTGGVGKQTSVFMRGTNSNHVLVLVDGMRFGSSTAGTISWEHLPLAVIERVEIVRGPRSSVYGSEAIGGVIQIFTRAGDGREDLADGNVEAGSNRTVQLSAGLTDRMGNREGQYSIRAATLRSAGIDAFEGVEPDRDGYRNDAVNAGFQYTLTPDSRLNVSLLHAEGRSEFDDTFGADADSRTQFVEHSAQVTWDQTLTSLWSVQARVGRSRDELDTEANGTATYRSHSQVSELGLQARYTTGTGSVLVTGADLRNDRVEYRDAFGGDSTAFARRSRDNTGIFVTGGTPFAGDGQVQASLRFDDNEAYGRHTSGNLELGWRLSSTTLLLARVGEAFKAPTFLDLYYPGFGNPDLKSEQSRTLELGLRQQAQWGNIELQAYRTRVTDLIQRVQNIGEAEIDGVELGLERLWGAWITGLRYTYSHPADGTTGERLPRRPESVLGLNLSRSWNTLQLDLDATYTSTSKDQDYGSFPAIPVTLSSFVLANLQLRQAFSPRFSAHIKLGNLLDEDYQTIFGYRNAGRTLSVGASLQF
ncbi:MAG: TonB-dependent receptor domain-containing protein [Thiotrichales bacterium]